MRSAAIRQPDVGEVPGSVHAAAAIVVLMQVAFNDLVTGSAKVLQTIISDGVRPQFPNNAPSWYVTLASRCWSGTAKSRTSFRRIVAQLHSLEKPLLGSAMPSAPESQEVVGA